jgi:hypothetical protein
MANWRSFLRPDVSEWLLAQSNPSVRYLTLTNIFGKEEANSEVRHAKEEIMVSGVVPKILGKLRDASWSSPGRFYRDKYKGTVWQLIILAEHAADGKDTRISGACEYILRHTGSR